MLTSLVLMAGLHMALRSLEIVIATDPERRGANALRAAAVLVGGLVLWLTWGAIQVAVEFQEVVGVL